MTSSIADLKAALVSDSDQLRLALLLWKVNKPTYEQWVDLVESAVAYEVRQLTGRRSDLHDLSEDALTAVLVIALGSLGLSATSTYVNGNCDVKIDYADEYVWLGEAKLFNGVSHVWGGYLQLTSRYATGMPGQNAGGILLYCVKASAGELLAEWRGALTSKVGHADATDGRLPLTFASKEVCASTGLPLSLTHFAFPLFHSPQEDVIKLGRPDFAAGRRSRDVAKKAAGRRASDTD